MRLWFAWDIRRFQCVSIWFDLIWFDVIQKHSLSLLSSPLSPSINPTLFHSRLKTYLFLQILFPSRHKLKINYFVSFSSLAYQSLPVYHHGTAPSYLAETSTVDVWYWITSISPFQFPCQHHITCGRQHSEQHWDSISNDRGINLELHFRRPLERPRRTWRFDGY